METKRFIGNNMDRLYERVRKELGPDAVIVRTRSLLREGAEPLIELTAGTPQTEAGLALDLQRTMLDGVLGRLERSTPRPTVADLEDIVARQDFEEQRPVRAVERAPAPAWMAGYVDSAPTPTRRHEAHTPATWSRQARPGHQEAGEPVAEAFPGFHLPRRPQAAPGIEAALIMAGFSGEAAVAVAHGAGPGLDAQTALVKHLEAHPAAYPDEHVTALITVQGPPGSGRTTALIRMALDCADTGRRTFLLAGDTARAAAREMMHSYSDVTEIPVLDAMGPESMAAALARVPHGACVFADVPAGVFAAPEVAGVTHYAYIALPATWQPEALQQALSGFDLDSAAGCIPTFVDMATSLAPVLSTIVTTALPLTFLSSGRDISTGIQFADPAALASGVFRTTTRETTDGHLVASA